MRSTQSTAIIKRKEVSVFVQFSSLNLRNAGGSIWGSHHWFVVFVQHNDCSGCLVRYTLCLWHFWKFSAICRIKHPGEINKDINGLKILCSQNISNFYHNGVCPAVDHSLHSPFCFLVSTFSTSGWMDVRRIALQIWLLLRVVWSHVDWDAPQATFLCKGKKASLSPFLNSVSGIWRLSFRYLFTSYFIKIHTRIYN